MVPSGVRSVFVGLLVASGLAAGPRPDAPRSPEEVRDKFFRCWVEVERVERGARLTDPQKHNLVGVLYTPEAYFSWLRRGELSAGGGEGGMRIDPTASPMRFEYRSADGRVNPGIFKFDGARLVTAIGVNWQAERPLGKGEDYKGRPTEFRSTKDNGVTVSVYVDRGKNTTYAVD